MKVILLQDIEGLGKKYEIKDVKNGHARNFLLPEKLAKAATKQALKWLTGQKEIIEKEFELILGKIKPSAEVLNLTKAIIADVWKRKEAEGLNKKSDIEKE